MKEKDVNISNHENKLVHLLFVGTIGERKGFFDLVKALENIDRHKYELHVCGEPTNDEARSEFEKCKDKLGKNLVFHGFVSGEERDLIY